MSSRWLRIFTPWSGSCILTTTRSIWAKRGGYRGCPGWPPPTPDPDSTARLGCRHQCAQRLRRTDGGISGYARRGARGRHGGEGRPLRRPPAGPGAHPAPRRPIATRPAPPSRPRRVRTGARQLPLLSCPPRPRCREIPGRRDPHPAPTLLRCGICAPGRRPAAMAESEAGGCRRPSRPAPPRPAPELTLPNRG